MTRAHLLAFAAVVAAATPACVHRDAPGPHVVRVGAQARHYQLFVPPGAERAPRPLVIALHGHYGTGAQMERSTGFDRIAAREGFVVAYPDGLDRGWADGREPATVDDVAFIAALIDDIAAHHAIDRARVYVTGMSNGAMMAYTLACRLGDQIAAIAPVTGELAANVAPTCAPRRPVAVLAINGQDDPLVPFAGGQVARRRGEVLSALASTATFARAAGCGDPAVTAEPDRVDDGTHAVRYVYACAADAPAVELVAIAGMGHTWPGGDQYLPRAIIGRVSHQLDASEAIWAFFAANHH